MPSSGAAAPGGERSSPLPWTSCPREGHGTGQERGPACEGWRQRQPEQIFVPSSSRKVQPEAGEPIHQAAVVLSSPASPYLAAHGALGTATGSTGAVPWDGGMALGFLLVLAGADASFPCSARGELVAPCRRSPPGGSIPAACAGDAGTLGTSSPSSPLSFGSCATSCTPSLYFLLCFFIPPSLSCSASPSFPPASGSFSLFPPLRPLHPCSGAAPCPAGDQVPP